MTNWSRCGRLIGKNRGDQSNATTLPVRSALRNLFHRRSPNNGRHAGQSRLCSSFLWLPSFERARDANRPDHDPIVPRIPPLHGVETTKPRPDRHGEQDFIVEQFIPHSNRGRYVESLPGCATPVLHPNRVLLRPLIRRGWAR